jgi:quercetin 2,3-dioxygenase
MNKIRSTKKILKSAPTLEGAGVHLKRAFGNSQLTTLLDPFLLLDEFHSTNPDDYRAGFPWHPHRGIETITYILYGQVEHGDSMGNKGVISSGDVQWMTAGSGIIHQEMPLGQEDGHMWGFQLWANLPASHKMMHPRYQDIKSQQIPVVQMDNGVSVRVICGKVNEVQGPVQDIITDPEYLDVTLPAQATFTHPVHAGYTVFAYVIDGKGIFDADKGTGQSVGAENLVIYGDGESVEVLAGAETGVRFLLISGKPIKEPVAWYGPIVMNTQEELVVAFKEYQQGTFLKHNQ